MGAGEGRTGRGRKGSVCRGKDGRGGGRAGRSGGGEDGWKVEGRGGKAGDGGPYGTATRTHGSRPPPAVPRTRNMQASLSRRAQVLAHGGS